MMAWIGGQDKMDTIYLGGRAGLEGCARRRVGSGRRGWTRPPQRCPGSWVEVCGPHASPTMQSRETWLSGEVRQPALPPGHP